MTVAASADPRPVQEAPPEGAPPQPPRRKRVLMLTHRMPYPPDRGDRIRSWHMLKRLARHFDVSIACTSDEPAWLQHHQLLSTIAKRVAIQPISLRYSKVKAVKAAVLGRTFTEDFYYRPWLANTILQWHEQAPFDAVLTFCSGMIRYARLLTGGRPREGVGSEASIESGQRSPRVLPAVPVHVLDLVDVDSVKWRSYARNSRPPMRWVYRTEANRLRRIEAGEHDHFDAVAVVSEAEAEAYRQHVGDHPGLMVVGNGVDMNYFHPLPDCDSQAIVFVGVLNYAPNADGVSWFVRHVLSALRERVPGAKLLIVGRHPTPQVEELGQQAGVEVVGSVSDVREYMMKASAVIAPLLLARGVQNKVLEAMSSARPVVCSSSAAQGIEAVDGQHLLVADQPQQWVEQLQRVLTDKPLRQKLGQAARRHVEERYGWEERLTPLVEALMGRAAGLSYR